MKNLITPPKSRDQTGQRINAMRIGGYFLGGCIVLSCFGARLNCVQDPLLTVLRIWSGGAWCLGNQMGCQSQQHARQALFTKLLLWPYKVHLSSKNKWQIKRVIWCHKDSYALYLSVANHIWLKTCKKNMKMSLALRS